MREVYNGYEEKNLTGAELKKLYPLEYVSDGRHHGTVLGITVKDFLSANKKIKDEVEYRVFVNDCFCKVMSKEDDKQIVFFSHITADKVRFYHDPGEAKLNLICPECGASMGLKEGKHGKFLGCSKYPDCKHTEKILMIGKLI